MTATPINRRDEPATIVESTTAFDKKGRPIRAYDLLRSYHFRDRRWGHQYLYHVAMPAAGSFLEAVPVEEIASGKSGGGRCWLTQENADGMEIIHGGGSYPDNIFQERSRETN